MSVIKQARPKFKRFSVIGISVAGDDRFIDHVLAEDAEHARAEVEKNRGGQYWIVATLPGYVKHA